MLQDQIEIFYPTNQKEWRVWLAENHVEKNAVWVLMYKKMAGKPTITWSESVDEALCYGWIDSIKKKLDDERSIQFFSKRKSKGTWSKINKDKVQKFIDNGQMTQTGLDCIATAKQNGSWTILDSVEALIIPQDLETALNNRTNAMDYFLSLSKSIRKRMLQWLVLAKRAETRQNRILEIVDCAERKMKPNQF